LFSLHRSLRYAALGVVVAIVYLAGGLSSVERFLHDARTHLQSRPASGELVVVAIDPDSLRWLDVWPWPRRYYAEAIEALLAAGAERLALDIDFSAFSQADDDRRLAAALAAAGPQRIALPTFRQLLPSGDGAIELVDTAPNALFAPHVAQVHADFRPDPDGLVRRLTSHYWRQGEMVPALSLWLEGGADAVPDDLQIDFSIAAPTIPRLSFADVLEGNFDPAIVAGRQVILGATADELGDRASVPRYRSLPGVLIHALAFESVRQQRALGVIGGWPVALAAIGLSCLLGPCFARLGAVRALALAVAAAAALLCLAALLQPFAAAVLEISPWLLVVLTSFGMALIQLVQRKDALMRQVVDNSFDAIVTFDEARRIRSFNRAAGRLFGRAPEEAIGLPLGEFLAALDDERAAPWAASDGGAHELVALPHSDRSFPVEAAISTMRVDDRQLGIAAIRDISDRKRKEAELRRMALHDPLTGLANRALLYDRLGHAIAGARRSGGAVALLLLDLDRFKEVNDTLGHQTGDRLLQQVAARLEQVLRRSDTLARLGGDEFALVLPSVDDATACAVAGRIVELFRRSFQVETFNLELGVSIGVALHPAHGEDASELLQRADVAMYAAKRGQIGFVVYDAENDRHSVRRLTLQRDLRRAIEDGSLKVVYQPKVAAADGRLTGAEALLRWQHPEHGPVPPDEFIALSEQTGLIRPLTHWVLESVLRQQAAWRAQGLEIAVAVNLSVRLLQDPAWPDWLQDLVRRQGGRPGQFVLEITESALMADTTTAMAVVARLAGMGFKLSLDDFGTGYSSLAYLEKLPIDELKIDRSFVLAMEHSRSAAMIVRSVVNLARSLELAVVAEGVESAETRRQLCRLGCDQIQGYLIAAPLAAADFEAWLAKTDGGTRAEDGCVAV
jgi:diguanylate cyclase (GGDEF)-like protein/PAS domain S-box-containing protein